MAVDERLVLESIAKLKEVFITIMKNKSSPNTPLTNEEFKEIFEKNAGLVDAAGINEEEAEKIKKLVLKYNPGQPGTGETFKEKMNEFENEHIKRLHKLDGLKEEKKKEQDEEIKESKKLLSGSAQAAAGIVHQVVEDDDQTRKYDELKKKYERLYYYVWWLLDSEEDYQTLLNDPHSYPRNRGTYKVQYKELGNKNIDEALSGAKSSGKVTGDYLGALGLIGRNEYFDCVVPRVDLKPGQIIALGAARAKRWDWRTREWRGLGNDKLLRADPERFIWKWDRHNPLNKEKGTIKGRVIEPEDFEAHKSDIGYLMNPDNDIGIAEADVWAESGDKNLVGTKKANDKGFFVLEGIPFNIAVTVKAKLDGSEYNPEEHKIPDTPIVLSTEKHVQENVIVPLKTKTEPSPPEFIITLHSYDAGHKEPLSPPFGNTEAFEVNKLNNEFRTFKVIKKKGSKKVENAWYYFVASQMQDIVLDNNAKDLVAEGKNNITIDGEITRISGPKKEKFPFKFNQLHHRPFKYGTDTDTLEVNFRLPSVSPNGKYRVWCLLLKSESVNLKNCWDFNYFEFYVGPIPKRTSPKDRDKILKDIEARVKQVIKEGNLNANTEQTLGWHNKKDSEKLQKIADEVQELEKLYPTFFQSEEVKKVYFDAMATLSLTIQAWEDETDMKALPHKTLKGLMKQILWLEEAIEYLKSKPGESGPKP